jgi:hypothetical protein
MGTKFFAASLLAQQLEAALRGNLFVGQTLSTPPSQVAKTGWALNGRIYTAQMQPAAGFTVFLVNATNTFQPQYGFSTTNSTGYFLLNYAGNSGKASNPAMLYIMVANPQKKPVYKSVAPFLPLYGALTNQNITLPG